MPGPLALLDRGVGGDDDVVVRGSQVGGGAIHAADPASSLSLDQIGRETGPLRDVVDVDLLEGNEVSRVHERRIEGEAAFVLEVGLGHPHTVDLGPEHFTLHRFFSWVRAIDRSRPLWFTIVRSRTLESPDRAQFSPPGGCSIALSIR